MSYNLLSGSVNFVGDKQGTVEDIVDTHSNQTISGQKTIGDLSGSTTHIATRIQIGGSHAVDHTVSVTGPVSASSAISASAFYADGVLVNPAGGGISFDGSTANGILTYKDADEATVESNLIFDGTVLDFKSTSISGSGNISGSAFFGSWAGDDIPGSQVQLASNGGLGDSSGLTLSIGNATAQTTPNGNVTLLIDDGGAIKKSTITQLLTNQSITDASTLGNTGRVMLDGGVGTIATDSDLTYNGSVLSVAGEVSASGNVNVGGILRADSHLSASSMTLAGRLSHEGDEDTYISLSNNSISFTADSGQHININGNNNTTSISNSDFKINLTRPDFRVFNSTGFTGIGTDSPTVSLEVSSSTATQFKLTYDIANAAEFAVASNGDLTISPSGSATFDSNLSINGNTVLGNSSLDTTTINGSAVACNNGLNFDSNTLFISASNNRVGVGTVTPGAALEVVGDVLVTGTTPFITIGDGGTEDCGILLNSSGSGVSGIDYYMAIDYSYNTNNGALMIGAGETVGTNSAIQIHNGRIGLAYPGVTPSSLSVDEGKHLVVGTMGKNSGLLAHNVDETVIDQATDSAGQALKIPKYAVITKVVLVVLTPSDLSTHNAAVFLASETSAEADSALTNKVELLGAGATGTKSTDSNGVDAATDIDLKQEKEVWINTDLNWVAGDRYVYLVNTGTSNGTVKSNTPSVIVYIEYYGAD